MSGFPQAGSSGVVLAEVHADAGAPSLNTEQTLATLAIPAGLIRVGDGLQVLAFGDTVNSSGSAVTYTWRLKIGGTTMLATPAFSHASNPDTNARRKWKFTAELEFPTTASERVTGDLLTTGATLNTMDAVATALVATGYGTAAEDTAAALNVVFTCQLGTAVSSADVVLHGASLVYFRKP